MRIVATGQSSIVACAVSQRCLWEVHTEACEVMAVKTGDCIIL
jgi:hypothetical protein